MKLYVLGFHCELAGPMQELSRSRPEVEWSVRPLGGRWLAEGEGIGRTGELSPPARRTLLVARSPWERAFFDNLDSWNAVALPPLVWRAGAVSLRLLSPRSSPPIAWRRRYPNLELVLKRPVRTVDLERETGNAPRWRLGVTDRQREVLGLAVQEGYYDVPRRTNVAGLARALGLGRSTVEEHLRIAESALVRATAPLMGGQDRGVARWEDADTWSSFARFSAAIDLYVWMVLHGDRIARVTLRRTPPPARAASDHPYLRRIVDHLSTGEDDLRDLPIELGLSPFDRRVLEEVRRIPPGRTASYQEVARRVGRPNAARAVGNALSRNPTLIVVPCHRVVPSSGGVGEYSGEGGSRTKARLLDREGVPASRGS